MEGIQLREFVSVVTSADCLNIRGGAEIGVHPMLISAAYLFFSHF